MHLPKRGGASNLRFDPASSCFAPRCSSEMRQRSVGRRGRCRGVQDVQHDVTWRHVPGFISIKPQRPTRHVHQKSKQQHLFPRVIFFHFSHTRLANRPVVSLQARPRCHDKQAREHGASPTLLSLLNDSSKRTMIKRLCPLDGAPRACHTDTPLALTSTTGNPQCGARLAHVMRAKSIGTHKQGKDSQRDSVYRSAGPFRQGSSIGSRGKSRSPFGRGPAAHPRTGGLCTREFDQAQPPTPRKHHLHFWGTKPVVGLV
jgi:hypothetical protein